MGKNKKSQVYHPHISQVKRQKQDENAPAFPVHKKKSSNKKQGSSISKLLENNMEVTIIDYTGQDVKIDAQDKYTELVQDNLSFDFNSKEVFNPDSNCTEVAYKLWNWFLNPLSMETFKNEIVNRQKALVIQRSGKGFTFDQQDPEDNIISLKMINEYLKIEIEQKTIEYGKHIDLIRYVNSKQFLMNQGEIVEQDYLDDFLKCQRGVMRLNKAHEFSISLAKVMSLTDEIMSSDVSCEVYMQNYLNNDSQKKNQLSQVKTSNFDQYILVIDGEIRFRFVNSQDHSNTLWKGTLKKGDFVYIPKNTSYQTKTVLDEDEDEESSNGHSLYLVLSHTNQQSWLSVIDNAMKCMSQRQLAQKQFVNNLPIDIYERERFNDNFKEYCSMIDQLSQTLKNKEQFEKLLHKNRVKYLINRQAPQEMIQPNETEEGEEEEEVDGDESMNEEKFEEIKKKAQEAQKNQKQGQQQQQQTTIEKDDQDFSEVKICSRNGAFLRQKHNTKDNTKKNFLYFATQNTRVRGETPKQRMEVPDQYAQHLETIVKSYPNYVKISNLKTEDKEGLLAFLNELAYLQVLIVN
ncbi:UNKNOWN [Stylonychia lemnae]|uniref:Bifunctional lysine-specific demethylase and histidyl-hydroxylase n=1 Tax=Stylonychia lemnae TaxID=5949 RepID=A0A078AQ06_STYLE|nr:UNKNOWN [Stylonychia lemnae]|eukprot:CDW84435.1 UNKNOWN [Stylonychia lemnae]